MAEAPVHIRRNLDTGETYIRITTSTRAGRIFRYDSRKLAPPSQIIRLMQIEIPMSNVFKGVFEEEKDLDAFLEQMKITYRVSYDAIEQGIVTPEFVLSDAWCSQLWDRYDGPHSWIPPYKVRPEPETKLIKERDTRTGKSRISIFNGGAAGKIFVHKNGVYQYTISGKDIAQQMANFPAHPVPGKKYLSSVAEITIVDEDEYKRFLDEVRESFEESRDAVASGEFAQYLKKSKSGRSAPRIKRRLMKI